MGMTLDELKKLCEGEGFKYFLDSHRPMVMMMFRGINGRFQLVAPVELDGRFLQIRTVSYLHCPPDHQHIEVVLRILGSLNYRLRMTKFGWDPSDGEIVAYADVWVEDGGLTQKQFGSLFKSLLPAIDLSCKRISTAMETGEDPGELTPESLPSPGDLPEELSALLEKLRGKNKDDDDEDEDEDEEWPVV
jgi:hypothetical protein